MSRIQERLDALPAGKRELIERLLGRTESKAPPQSAAPATDDESRLLSIWRDVLGQPQISAEDNFIAVGGDSIRAIQISARARQAGLVFPADECFRHPTVRELARAAASPRVDPANDAGRPRPIERSRTDTLSFGEERLWLEHQARPTLGIYNTFTALRVEGAFRRDIFERALQALVARHDILRTSFHEKEGRPYRVIRPELIVPVPLTQAKAQGAAAQGGAVAALAAPLTLEPFAIEVAPLFRCALVQFDDNTHYLVLVAHHIICDAWSIRLLVQELIRVYEAFCYDAPIPLTPLEVRYSDFAHWQRQCATSEAMTAQRTYWRDTLRDAPPVHQLPLSKPRPATRSFKAGVHFFSIPQASRGSLDGYARQEGVTRYVALLSAYFLTLYSYSEQRDLLVGTPVIDRPMEEVQGIVGFFLNTVVLRARLHPEVTLTALIRQINSVVAEAQRHWEVPYEQVFADLRVQRESAWNPLFQLWFVLQDGVDQPLRCANLRLRPVELDRALAPFDLALSVRESEQGFRCWLEYSADIFDLAFAERFAARFACIAGSMEQFAERPGTALLEYVREHEAESEDQRRRELRGRIREFRRD